MRLIVGAPVADRAWSLPRWFACLERQTRQPDGFIFLHSGTLEDDTWRIINNRGLLHPQPFRIGHDWAPPHPRHDNTRFATLARLRNDLLHRARFELDADLFLSLDTDVMLEDPGTIERLERLVIEDGWDVASPVTWLHPSGEGSWAYNAGWWNAGGTLGDPRRPWCRPAPDTIPWGEVVEIGVPMAAMLMNRRAMDCRYRWHEGGEDLGFAQDLDRQGLRVAWDTALKAFHAWDKSHLEERQAAG